MTPDQIQRLTRTAIQAAVPALVAMIAALTTEFEKVTAWWAPLVLAGLTVVTSVIHQKMRPAVAPDKDTV